MEGYSSWIIGTLILWVLKAVAVVPFANYLVNSGVVSAPAEPTVLETSDSVEGDSEQKEGDTSAEAEEESEGEGENIPAMAYILADVAVLTLVGFLIGVATGTFFIGISWKARDWPGMIAFIISSMLGSALA